MAINVIGGGGSSGGGSDLGSTIVAAFQVPVAGSGKFAITGGLAAGNYVIEWRGSLTNSAAIYGYIGTTPALLASSLTTYSSGNTGSVGLNNYVFTTTVAYDGLYITGFSGAVIVRRWTAATSATLTTYNWAAFGGTFPSTQMISNYSVASIGTTIVAVNYTSGPFVQLSTDAGSTWNMQAASVSYLGNIGSGNGLFVAAPWGSSSSSVTTSTNGSTWTSRTMTINQIWNGNPHYAASLSTPRWIVPGVNGSANISTDGVTWTNAPIAAGSGNFFVGSGGGIAIALRPSESTYYTSTDLSTWTSRTFPITVGGSPFITYAGGKFIVSAISNSVYYTSTDGVNWTSNNNPVATAGPITFTNGVYNYGVIQNQPDGSRSRSWVSNDLVVWYARDWNTNTNYAGIPAVSTSHFHYLPLNNGSIAAGRTAAALDSLT
jgi:hypothetical protein